MVTKPQPPETTSRPPLPVGSGAAGDWQLRLHQAPDGRSGWRAEAIGPGGAPAFASIAELVRWLVQLEPNAGRDIR